MIESNQRYGVKRFRVEKVIVIESHIYLETVAIDPKDGVKFPPRVECYFGGLLVEGDKLVDHWTYPDQSGYEYLTEDFVKGQPARKEFRIVERAWHEEQLDLFGE